MNGSVTRRDFRNHCSVSSRDRSEVKHFEHVRELPQPDPDATVTVDVKYSDLILRIRIRRESGPVPPRGAVDLAVVWPVPPRGAVDLIVIATDGTAAGFAVLLFSAQELQGCHDFSGAAR